MSSYRCRLERFVGLLSRCCAEVVCLQHSVSTTQRWGGAAVPPAAGSSVTLLSGVTDCWRWADLLTFYFWPLMSLRQAVISRGTVVSNPQPLLTLACHTQLSSARAGGAHSNLAGATDAQSAVLASSSTLTKQCVVSVRPSEGTKLHL